MRQWLEFGFAVGFFLSMILALFIDFEEFWDAHHSTVRDRVGAYTDEGLVPEWAHETFAAIDALPTLETTAEMES